MGLGEDRPPAWIRPQTYPKTAEMSARSRSTEACKGADHLWAAPFPLNPGTEIATRLFECLRRRSRRLGFGLTQRGCGLPFEPTKRRPVLQPIAVRSRR